MCNNPDLLTDRTPYQTSILGAVSAKTVKSTEIGTAHLICCISDRTQAIDLKKVLLVPVEFYAVSRRAAVKIGKPEIGYVLLVD